MRFKGDTTGSENYCRGEQGHNTIYRKSDKSLRQLVVNVGLNTVRTWQLRFEQHQGHQETAFALLLIEEMYMQMNKERIYSMQRLIP